MRSSPTTDNGDLTPDLQWLRYGLLRATNVLRWSSCFIRPMASTQWLSFGIRQTPIRARLHNHPTGPVVPTLPPLHLYFSTIFILSSHPPRGHTTLFLFSHTHTLSRPRHHADQPAVLSSPRARSGGIGASAEQPKPHPPDRGGHANGARRGRPLGALHQHDEVLSLLERRDQLPARGDECRSGAEPSARSENRRERLPRRILETRQLDGGWLGAGADGGVRAQPHLPGQARSPPGRGRCRTQHHHDEPARHLRGRADDVDGSGSKWLVLHGRP